MIKIDSIKNRKDRNDILLGNGNGNNIILGDNENNKLVEALVTIGYLRR